MTREDIFNVLLDSFLLITKDNEKVKNVKMNSNLLELGVDSVTLIYLAVIIEEKLGVNMGELSVNSFKDLNLIIDYIQERIKK